MKFDVRFVPSADEDLDYYEIREEGLVRVLAVGHKIHNELFIRGQRVEI